MIRGNICRQYAKSEMVLQCSTHAYLISKKVQVGNNQEKAQSERNSHLKNRDGKKLN